jgi:hypothetical protein
MGAAARNNQRSRMPARRQYAGQLPAYLLDQEQLAARCLPNLQRIGSDGRLDLPQGSAESSVPPSTASCDGPTSRRLLTRAGACTQWVLRLCRRSIGQVPAVTVCAAAAMVGVAGTAAAPALAATAKGTPYHDLPNSRHAESTRSNLG